jgi:hypothetical protein
MTEKPPKLEYESIDRQETSPFRRYLLAVILVAVVLVLILLVIA